MHCESEDDKRNASVSITLDLLLMYVHMNNQ